MYKSELRRFEKLLREQERIYETKLISKEEEIKLLHIRIESIRLGKEAGGLLGVREMEREREREVMKEREWVKIVKEK